MKNDDKNSQEPYESEEAMTAKQVSDGLEKIEQWHSVSTPKLQWFQQQVELEKKEYAKNNGKNCSSLSLFPFLFCPWEWLLCTVSRSSFCMCG